MGYFMQVHSTLTQLNESCFRRTLPNWGRLGFKHCALVCKPSGSQRYTEKHHSGIHNSLNNSPSVTHNSLNNLPRVSHNSLNNSPSVTHNSLNNSPSVTHNSLNNSPRVSHNSLNSLPSVTHKSLNNSPRVSHNSLNNSPRVSHNSLNSLPSVTHKSLNNSPRVSHNSLNNSPRVSHNSLNSLPSVTHKSWTVTYNTASVTPQLYIVSKLTDCYIIIHSVIMGCQHSFWWKQLIWPINIPFITSTKAWNMMTVSTHYITLQLLHPTIPSFA